MFPPVLYIEGPPKTGKTQTLAQRLLALLQQTPSNTILCFVATTPKKHALAQRLAALNASLDASLAVGPWPVHTLGSWVRQQLQDHWPRVEARLCQQWPTQCQLSPLLVGTEETEWLLQHVLSSSPALAEGFASFPGSMGAVTRQLIRRLRFRSEWAIDRAAMAQRSHSLKEPYVEETRQVEAAYDRLAYQTRLLDASKQLDVFLGLLAQEPDFAEQVLGPIAHLLADDVDEATPALQGLLRRLLPQVETATLACDLQGGTRRGYLNAYPDDWPGLKALRDGETDTRQRNDAVAQSAAVLLERWLAPQVENTFPDNSPITLHTLPTVADLYQSVPQFIQQQLAQGRQLGDIALITPQLRPWTQSLLAHWLQPFQPVQFLSSQKHPATTPVGQAFLTLLKYLRPNNWPAPPVQKALRQAQKTLQPNMAEYIELLQQQQASWKTPESYALCGLTAPCWQEAPFEQPVETLMLALLNLFQARLKASPYATEPIIALINHYDRFKKTQQQCEQPVDLYAWLVALQQRQSSNSSGRPQPIDAQALVVATPQQWIDSGVYRPVQFWFDVGSAEWARTDNAPLYTCWQLDEGTVMTPALADQLARVRAGHLTRTLLLGASQVVALASQENLLGQQALTTTQAPFWKCLSGTANTATNVADLETLLSRSGIVLREDQAPVLNWQQGPMAVVAVPGAGKTFTLVALLLHLISQGIAPQQLLVLTYMDSAAQTMLSRVKPYLSEHGDFSESMPTICTVHALAYRILTEGEAGLSLGIMPDQLRIIDSIDEQLWFSGEDGKAFREAIRWCKEHHIGPDDLKKSWPNPLKYAGSLMRPFIDTYAAYQDHLTQQHLFDYTDLIRLAIELLQNNAPLRHHWQQRFWVVIEDEAQDSSPQQQVFLRLLATKETTIGQPVNLIRTGDPNQSINSTFSSANPRVFTNFCQQPDTTVVSMNYSSRSAPEIIQLANAWQADHPEALTSLAMCPTAHNPMALWGQDSIQVHEAETEADEAQWVLEQIHAVRQADPQASIALLVRTNASVFTWYEQLQQAGVVVVALTENMQHYQVFQQLYGMLEALSDETPAPPIVTDATQACWPEWLEQACGQDIPALIVAVIQALYGDFSGHAQAVAAWSQGYVLAQWAEQSLQRYWDIELPSITPLEWVLGELNDCVRRNGSVRGFKDWFERGLSALSIPVVFVMTLHKSKGREFDAVFMTGLNKSSFESELADCRASDPQKLQLALCQWHEGQRIELGKMLETRQLTLAEMVRLLYVGMTRAKRALFLSYAKKTSKNKNQKSTEKPSAFWQWAQQQLLVLP